MDRVSKAVQKLTEQEKLVMEEVLTLLSSGQTSTLDIMKIRGRNDIFRARKGNFRIIYREKSKIITILAIERRSEKAYRDF